MTNTTPAVAPHPASAHSAHPDHIAFIIACNWADDAAAGWVTQDYWNHAFAASSDAGHAWVTDNATDNVIYSV